MRLLLLLASAAAISKVPKAPTAGRAAAISSKTPQKPTTGRAAAKAQAEQAKPLALSGGGANKQVSYAWAVLHNWLYFLSLGLCIPVLPKVIASTVNDDGAAVSDCAGVEVEVPPLFCRSLTLRPSDARRILKMRQKKLTRQTCPCLTPFPRG